MEVVTDTALTACLQDTVTAVAVPACVDIGACDTGVVAAIRAVIQATPVMEVMVPAVRAVDIPATEWATQVTEADARLVVWAMAESSDCGDTEDMVAVAVHRFPMRTCHAVTPASLQVAVHRRRHAVER